MRWMTSSTVAVREDRRLTRHSPVSPRQLGRSQWVAGEESDRLEYSGDEKMAELYN